MHGRVGWRLLPIRERPFGLTVDVHCLEHERWRSSDALRSPALSEPPSRVALALSQPGVGSGRVSPFRGRLLPAALAAIVFYVIGIPTLFAFLLYSIRKNKNGKGPLGLMSSLYAR